MRRRAAGVGVVEMLLALVLGALVLALALAFFSVGWKLGRVAEGAVTLSSAGLLENILTEELAQLGVDPARGSVLEVEPDRLAFDKASFSPGASGPIRLSRVVLHLRPAQAGLQQLDRIEEGVTRTVPTIWLSGARFERVGGPGSQVVRLAGVLRECPAGGRSLPLFLVVAVPVAPEALNPALALATRFIR